MVNTPPTCARKVKQMVRAHDAVVFPSKPLSTGAMVDDLSTHNGLVRRIRKMIILLYNDQPHNGSFIPNSFIISLFKINRNATIYIRYRTIQGLTTRRF